VPGESSLVVTASGDGVSSFVTIRVQVLQPRVCLGPGRSVRSSCNGSAPVRSQVGR
jgi:hypothetical protein